MSRRARAAVVIALVALIVAVASVWVVAARRDGAVLAGGDLETLHVYGRVPPFSLVERSGRRVTSDDLRGVVWITDFVYTECTDTCPLQSAALARVQDAFADASGLRLVSISVDPAHDTPDVLRAYAARYRAGDHWWFLTGDRSGIYCLAKDGFHLGVVDPSVADALACGAAFHLGPARAWAHDAAKGPIAHSARVALVDGELRIRAYHTATDPASIERLEANVQRLLKER